MSLYYGANSVQREVSKLYTGIIGGARELREIYTAQNGVKKLVHQAAKNLGSFPIGSIVKISENGIPVNYLIVHQGLPSSMYDASCDGTWILRQDVAKERPWDYSLDNRLNGSSILDYLNDELLNRYNADIKSAIKQVKIPYHEGGGEDGNVLTGSKGIPCKLFMLSCYEVGWTNKDDSDFPVDGAKLAYFESGTSDSANAKRVARLDDIRTDWWLRSPLVSYRDRVWVVGGYGKYDDSLTDEEFGYRPALILPFSVLVDDLGYILP